MDFHRRVTDSAGAHLALLCENTIRTPWIAAKLLSQQRDLAQGTAKDLARHLAATNPVNRTPSSNTFLQRPISGKTWLSSPQSNLLCSSGMVKEGLRPSSGSWLQGSSWHLTMCWMQRESMHVGSGSATSKGISSSCISMLAYGLLTTSKTARHVLIVQISALTCWLRHKRTE